MQEMDPQLSAQLYEHLADMGRCFLCSRRGCCTGAAGEIAQSVTMLPSID